MFQRTVAEHRNLLGAFTPLHQRGLVKIDKSDCQGIKGWRFQSLSLLSSINSCHILYRIDRGPQSPNIRCFLASQPQTPNSSSAPTNPANKNAWKVASLPTFRHMLLYSLLSCLEENVLSSDYPLFLWPRDNSTRSLWPIHKSS